MPFPTPFLKALHVPMIAGVKDRSVGSDSRFLSRSFVLSLPELAFKEREPVCHPVHGRGAPVTVCSHLPIADAAIAFID